MLKLWALNISIINYTDRKLWKVLFLPTLHKPKFRIFHFTLFNKEYWIEQGSCCKASDNSLNYASIRNYIFWWRIYHFTHPLVNWLGLSFLFDFKDDFSVKVDKNPD